MVDKALEDLTQATPDTGDIGYSVVGANSRKYQFGVAPAGTLSLSNLTQATPDTGDFAHAVVSGAQRKYQFGTAPRLGVFTPEQYGAVGDGSTDDATAFTAMFSAVTSAGGGECRLTKTYLLASAVSLPNNVRVIGDGKATIKAHASNAIGGLFTCTSSASNSDTLASNASLFDRDLTLTDATGFSVGRLVVILKTVGGGVFYHHTAEITGVSGSVITITPPMPFALATADTYTLSARAPVENISIEHLKFDGNDNTAVTRGLLLQYTSGLFLEDLRFEGFHGAAAAYIDAGFATDISNLQTSHCGTGSEAAIHIRAQTAGHFHGINDWYSHGFGQLHFMLTYCHLDTLSSNRAGNSVTGRGVKFDGLLYSTADGVQGNNSSSTGIAITLGSSFNTFSNLIALKNTGSGAANDIGLWFDGTSSDNLVNGLIAKGNNTLDISIPSGSNRNTLLNAVFDTITDAGTGNAYDIVGTWTPDITFATAGDVSVGYTTQAGQYRRKGREITAHFQVLTSSFSHSTAAGNFRLNGLPFAPATDNIVGTLRWQGITQGANHTNVYPVTSTAGRLEFRASGSGQNVLSITTAHVPTGGSIQLFGTVTYEV